MVSGKSPRSFHFKSPFLATAINQYLAGGGRRQRSHWSNNNRSQIQTQQLDTTCHPDSITLLQEHWSCHCFQGGFSDNYTMGIRFYFSSSLTFPGPKFKHQVVPFHHRNCESLTNRITNFFPPHFKANILACFYFLLLWIPNPSQDARIRCHTPASWKGILFQEDLGSSEGGQKSNGALQCPSQGSSFVILPNRSHKELWFWTNCEPVLLINKCTQNNAPAPSHYWAQVPMWQDRPGAMRTQQTITPEAQQQAQFWRHFG